MTASRSDLRIRAAAEVDIPGIVRCSAALLAEDAAARDPEVDPEWPLREGHAAFAATLGDPAFLLLVAVTAEPSDVVGYLIGLINEPVGVLPIRSAVLRALYVDPSHRRGGTGTRLTAEFLGWARQQDATRAEVNAYSTNEDSLRFYRAQGFTPRAVRLDLPLAPPSPAPS